MPRFGSASPFQIELSDIVPASLLVRIEFPEFLIQDIVRRERGAEKQEQHAWDKAKGSRASWFSHGRV